MNKLELCNTQCFQPDSSVASTSNSSVTNSDIELEVLFVDSFDSIENEAHSLQDGKRCGLIQFSGPIIIHELLLIPLFETAVIRNGNLTLGATIPPEFDITFYVNDLKAEEASTFLDIGTLSYRQTDRYLFKPSCLVPTDGLFFRGNFENVTLSVHGVRVSVLPDESETHRNTEHVTSNVNCDIYRIDNDRQRVQRINNDLPDDDLYFASHDDEPIRDETRHSHHTHQQSSHYKYSRTPPPVASIKSPSPAHSIKSSSSSSNHRSNSQNLPKSFSRYMRDDVRAESNEHSTHRSDRYHSLSSRRSPSPAGYSYNRHHSSSHHRTVGSNRDSSVESFEQGRRAGKRYYRGRPSSRGSNRSRSSSKSSQQSLSRSLALRPINSPKQHFNSSCNADKFSIRAFSPLSNASSISKTSLKSLGSVHENGSTNGTPNRQGQTPTLRAITPQKSPTPVKAFQKELFETLSSSDDFSDMETENVSIAKTKVEVRNFEKISWSSDDELGNEVVENIDIGNEHPVSNVEDTTKKNELEEISSDDEIPNDENDYDLISDLHDTDIDDSLDICKNIFDPFKNNQLSPVIFPLNTFSSGLNLDGKQLSVISEYVHTRFAEFYPSDDSTNVAEPIFDENWIKDVEQLSVDIMKLTLPLGEKTKGDCVMILEFKELIRILVCITKDSLNFDIAQKQKQGFKVRHLKAGIKLFISLFYSLEMKQKTVQELLLHSNLAYHLIELYDKPFMTLSMRLLLLNALNIACDHSEFVEFVITKSFQWNTNDSYAQNSTLYQHLLEIVLKSKATSRLSNSFEEFLTKVHLYEFCQQLSTENDPILIENRLEQLKNVFIKFSNQIHRPLRLFSDLPQFDIKSSTHASAPLLLLSLIEIDSKNEQFNVCKNRLSCFHSSCPASKIGYFAQKSIYRYMLKWKVLQVIVDSLEKLSESDDVTNIVQLMDLISSHHQGRCYLLHSHNVQLTNRIHSLLMLRNVSIGTKFITRLFTFQTVDSIFQVIYPYPSLSTNSAFTGLECQVMNHLFELDCMIHLDNGTLRESVLHVLTSDHNFDGILAFLLPFTPGNPILDIQMSAFIYASRIASFCLQNLPERNIFHFLDCYGKVLMKCFENMQALKKNEAFHWLKFGKFEVHFNSFLTLEKWFLPFKNLNISESKEELCIDLILAILKKYGDLFQEIFSQEENSAYRIFEFEPELLVAVKMMLALCDPSVDEGKNRDSQRQLCYKANVVKFYSSDCLTYILTILDGLCETFSRPSHLPYIWNTFGEIQSKGTIVQELIRVCIRSSSIILNYVVSSIGEKFQDTSSIESYLRVYHFLSFYKSAYNSNSIIYKVSKSVQDDIVDTFKNVYCQVFVTQTDSIQSLKKSVWNKFLKIILNFILKKPQNILSTLQILGRLSPENDVLTNIAEFDFGYRKVWAVHFHILSLDIENVFSTLLLTDCNHVQIELRKFFLKLCNLYSPSVILVCKILSENILMNLNILMKARKDSLFLGHLLMNFHKIISIVCDLFKFNISFRIGILNSFYHLGTAEVGRKTTLKIYPILTKMFDFFDKIKLDSDIQVDSHSLLKHLFGSNEEKDCAVEALFEQYYEENKKLIFDKENFTLSEKALEKYRKSSSESLNDFFTKISSNSSLSGDSQTDNKGDDSFDSSIYSSEFVSLYRSMEKMNLSMKLSSDFKGSDSSLRVNFTEMFKQYLKIDSSTLNKTFETFFSTVVQVKENDHKAQSEEKVLETNPTLKRAPIRTQRRNNYSRVDLFRSRALNTSRPPSMHVDDFEALGSHGNSCGGGLKRVSHHAALLQNNSAPYAKQLFLNRNMYE